MFYANSSVMKRLTLFAFIAESDLSDSVGCKPDLMLNKLLSPKGISWKRNDSSLSGKGNDFVQHVGFTPDTIKLIRLADLMQGNILQTDY
jgi:hypothetical protein